MPILPVEQTFSLVGPVKRFCFLKYALKGTANVLLTGFFFFFSPCKYMFERQCLGGLGQHFPSLLPRPLVPSVPIKGFVRREKQGEFERQSNRRGNCFLGAPAGLPHDGSRAVGPRPSLLHPPPQVRADRRCPCASVEDKGAGLEGKLPSGRHASDLPSIPEKNDTRFELLKVDSFPVCQCSRACCCQSFWETNN